MITIIAGSREGFTDKDVERACLNCGWKITRVLSGTARGVDKLAENWANERCIPLTMYPADWNKYRKSAGYRRNAEMANNAEALVALWDGVSRGTCHMIEIAKSLGLKVYVYNKT